MLISKCASGHKGVHFFERRKFQKHCLVHFDFEMCFAPQQRSLFQQINVPKKGSEMLRLLTFWLQNVVRAIAACNFWFLIQPDGSAPTALASLLFSLLEPQSNGNTQCFATFLPFRTPAPSFFWLLLFSNLLSSSFLFSDSSHLCFSICPYCRKFDFQTSFDNDNESVWKCACQLLLSQFEVLQPQGWQPYSLCFARGIAKAPRSPPTVVLCCRHRRWCWQPSRRFVWVCSGLFQVMFRFVDGGYAVSGGCVCVCFSAVSGPLSKAKYVLVLTSLRAYTLLGWSPHLVTGSPLIGTLWNGHSSWPYIMERPCPFHTSLVSQSKENAPGSGHFAMAWSEMWIAGWRRLKAVGFFHRKWSQTDQFHHKKRNMN